ncbi:mCG1046397, isoform CRA_a, partial [Mus musculus]
TPGEYSLPATGVMDKHLQSRHPEDPMGLDEGDSLVVFVWKATSVSMELDVN